MLQRSLGIHALAIVFCVAGLHASAHATSFDFASIARFLEASKTPTEGKSPALGVVQTPATPQAGTPAQAAPSRALPSPMDSPPFPDADWAVNGYTPIGENWDSQTGALQKAIFGSKDSKIKVYGWVDVGGTYSTAKNSNLPYSYMLVPNHPELDQFVLRVDQMPDTVQTDHVDYGFRFTSIYGTDYRFTAAAGYFSDQLLTRNALYGWDPVEMFGMVYFPKWQQGTVVQFGRYISPCDIEAQLAPQNYLYSHSDLFTIDPYTYTGINAQVRYSPYLTIMYGVHAGNDQAPWAKSAEPNAELMVGLNSKDNKDSLWAGIDSIGKGEYSDNHDQLQIAAATWGHKFDSRWHMQTEAYYMWEFDAALGGTAISGPSEPYAGGGGAGPIMPGMSVAMAAVNYLEYKIDDKSYMTFRTDFLDDTDGFRTGYANRYASFTLGWSRFLNATTQIRPEIRWDQAFDQAAFDNGTRKSLFTIGCDVIYRF